MPPFIISLGDPAGVGPEVTARAWEQRHRAALPAFVAVGDVASIRAVWAGPVQQVDNMADGMACFEHALPVWHVEDSGPLTPGKPTAAGAHCALHALELAVGMSRTGDAAGMVTAPICKDQLYQVGFTHAGQTEFIADRCGVSHTNAVMMLAGSDLRVVPITVHVPMRDVSDLLTIDLVVCKTLATARAMGRNLGISHPRLALAGFNPHAGENGAIGREEIDILIPAIAQLAAQGLNVTGPHSPDALFTPLARLSYDVAMCIYHDQALIPLKALYFDEGVNITLGLPIIRTSPDHGTAFNIAGSGTASPGPMIAAIRMAGVIASQRADDAG